MSPVVNIKCKGSLEILWKYWGWISLSLNEPPQCHAFIIHWIGNPYALNYHFLQDTFRLCNFSTHRVNCVTEFSFILQCFLNPQKNMFARHEPCFKHSSFLKLRQNIGPSIDINFLTFHAGLWTLSLCLSHVSECSKAQQVLPSLASSSDRCSSSVAEVF